jgi:hypothetical protein
MLFPKKHCIEVAKLSEQEYNLLVHKLTGEGNKNCITHITYELAKCWGYVGVNDYGDIMLYAHPYSFLAVNEWGDYLNVPDKEYPNILTKYWITEYLK